MNRDWKDIFRKSAPLLVLMALIGVGSGQILQSIEETLLQIPVFLFLIPVMNGLGGNIGTILAARLSSALHMGNIEPDFSDQELRENVWMMALMAAIVYGTVIISLTVASTALPLEVLAWNLVMIVAGSAAIITMGTLGLTITTSIISYRMQLDPDDVVIPVITTLIDLLSVFSLFLMMKLVLL